MLVPGGVDSWYNYRIKSINLNFAVDSVCTMTRTRVFKCCRLLGLCVAIDYWRVTGESNAGVVFAHYCLPYRQSRCTPLYIVGEDIQVATGGKMAVRFQKCSSNPSLNILSELVPPLCYFIISLVIFSRFRTSPDQWNERVSTDNTIDSFLSAYIFNVMERTLEPLLTIIWAFRQGYLLAD